MDKNQLILIIITTIGSILASSGLWTFVTSRRNKTDYKTDMLIGLGHDRIVYLGMTYIERGWILQDEYENLNDYLYKPYKALGGNGSAERVMDGVRQLEILKKAPNGNE